MVTSQEMFQQWLYSANEKEQPQIRPKAKKPAGTGVKTTVHKVGSGNLEHGYLYVIQLVPELNPLRLKIGFAVDVNRRLDTHRTTAPTLKWLESFSCPRNKEVEARRSITIGCLRLSREVYEVDSVEKAMGRAYEFFSHLPGKVLVLKEGESIFSTPKRR